MFPLIVLWLAVGLSHGYDDFHYPSEEPLELASITVPTVSIPFPTLLNFILLSLSLLTPLSPLSTHVPSSAGCRCSDKLGHNPRTQRGTAEGSCWRPRLWRRVARSRCSSQLLPPSRCVGKAIHTMVCSRLHICHATL